MTLPQTIPRRFFRFRLRTLLLLPVVFAAGWWWITWPGRTAARFAASLTAHEIDSSRAMSDLPQPSDAFWKLVASRQLHFGRPIIIAPTWAEWLQGQRRFVVPWDTAESSGDLREFVAARGRVSLNSAQGKNVAISYSLKNSKAKDMASALMSVYQTPSGSSPDYHFSFDALQNRVSAGVPDSVLPTVCDLIEQLDKASAPVDSRPKMYFLPPYQRSQPGEELQIKIPHSQAPQ